MSKKKGQVAPFIFLPRHTTYNSYFTAKDARWERGAVCPYKTPRSAVAERGVLLYYTRR